MDFRTFDRTWIVAEIGVNHEGNPDVAADLVRKAAACGADAVKFQTYEAAHYVSTVQPERRDRVRRFQLDREDFRRLAVLARELGVTFFSTPLGIADVDFLDDLVPVFKVSSGDITHLDLIRHAASKGKPMIVSTGLATVEEIDRAVQAILSVRPSAREDGALMLMHCIAAYPAPADAVNLRNVGWLAARYGVPVGYSDHTLGIKACELAVAAGAVAIEKHFTYRKEDQVFHDHALSADPDDMAALVAAIRTAESHLGRPERVRHPSEEAFLGHLRRSVAAAVDIPAGVPVSADWLTALRPCWGIPAEEAPAVVGRRLNRAVAAGDIIRPEDLA